MTGIQVSKRKEFSKALHYRQHIPCPWCGGKARRVSRREGKGVGQILYAITCIYKNCPVNPTTKWFKEARYALSAWNRRKNIETTMQRFMRLRRKDGDKIPPMSSQDLKWEDTTSAGIRTDPYAPQPRPPVVPAPEEEAPALDLDPAVMEEKPEEELDLYDEQQ